VHNATLQQKPAKAGMMPVVVKYAIQVPILKPLILTVNTGRIANIPLGILDFIGVDYGRVFKL